MKTHKILLGFSTLCLVTFGAVSCGSNTHNDSHDIVPTETTVTDFNVATNEAKGTNTFSVVKNPATGKYDGQSGTIIVKDILPSDGKATFFFETDEAGKKIITLGKTSGAFVCKAPGEAKVKIRTKVTDSQPEIVREIVIKVVEASEAKGAFNYQEKSYEERAEITGLLEGWAMDNHLTGITLFQNGGYVLYNKRLKLGADHYIPGFGYGNLSNGEITEKKPTIDSNKNPIYEEYYHAVLSTNPQDINYLNSQGQVVGDLYGYISAGLWSTKLNDAKNGYDWYNCLAKSDIEPVNPDPVTGLASTFKVKVKTGVDGLTYQTTSSKLKNEGFNDRPVVIDDYITAYEMLLTQFNQMQRGAELTSMASDGTLKGAPAFYNLTQNVNPLTEKEELDQLFEMVGIKKDPESPEDTLIFDLLKPTTKFYAKYALSGSLTQPIPFDLIKKIGGMKYYGTASDSRGVIDNILCLGPYLLENWDNKNGGNVIFKLNEKFIDKLSTDPSISNRYKIKGIYNFISPSIKPNDLLNYFKMGVIDACGVPADQLDKWIDKEECHLTEGDSTFKLNVNSSTQAEWNAHYDEVFKKSNKAKKYTVKKIMSNDSFLKGLNECIDRKAYAEYVGATPSQDYFGSGYLYDPETGKSYNDSIYHQANLATRFPETYGYNREAAIRDFKHAVDQLVQSGAYSLPCKETITIHWMNTDDPELYGYELEKYIETTFNDPAVSDGKFKLDVVNIPGSTNYEEVYSEHLQVGNYDLGFGSISGNALNPLNFLEVLKSDNSSGFTLNWGRSTAEVDHSLIYDGKAWSFDALWTAGNSNAIVGNDGGLVKEPLQLDFDAKKDLKYDKASQDYDVVVKWNVDNILSGVKDTKLYIDKTAGVTVSVVLPKGQGGKEQELVFVMVPQDEITYEGNTIKFKIKKSASTEKDHAKIVKATKIRFQVTYNIEVGGKKSQAFFEKEFKKFDDSLN